MRPRIRSLKPEVHLDEELWDVEQQSGMPLYRLFTGLWNFSDREGRFEWRPRVLKAGILPWWDGDLEAALGWLTPKFVVRYEVGGRPYGWVRTFKKHQHLNNREPPSILPAPPAELAPANDNGVPRSAAGAQTVIAAAATRAARVLDASVTREKSAPGEGKGSGRGAGAGGGRRVRDAPSASPRQPPPLRADTVPSPPATPPPPLGSETLLGPMFDSGDIVRSFSELRQGAGGGSFIQKHSDYRAAQAVVEWARRECPEDPLGACTTSIAHYLRYARGRARDEGWPFWIWADDPGRWFAMNGQGGPMGRVGSQTEFEHDAKSNPSWADEEPHP